MRIAEQNGFEKALINIGAGKQILKENKRRGQRSIIDSPTFSSVFFSRLKPYLPREWKNFQLLGINERLRVLKYEKGDFFGYHRDGQFKREGEQRFITVQLYLSSDCEGGSTIIYYDNPIVDGFKKEDMIDIEMKTGRVIVFQHDIYHESSPLISGTKYTIRSDVMYSSSPSSSPSYL